MKTMQFDIHAAHNKAFERTPRQFASHQSFLLLSVSCVSVGQPLNSGVGQIPLKSQA